jgi:ribonuclease BN (tRNA processing enzyme)
LFSTQAAIIYVVEFTNRPQESILFLGTGGARMMVESQVLASGGIWLKMAGTEVLLDPGPGSIVRVTDRKLDASRLSAVIISHRHLDHSADVNIMLESMVRGGTKPHGWFFAPADALNSEPVMYSYLKKYLEGIGILKEGGTYALNGLSFNTPLRHMHSVETYGITFKGATHSVSYIADSLYFEGLAQAYKSDLIIINTVFNRPIPHVDHLSIPDAKEIILGLKPKAAILTHFGPHLYEDGPERIAAELSDETGTRVIAAKDGMEFDLKELDSL